MTLRTLLNQAVQQLEAAGIITNTPEIERIFAAASGQSRQQIILEANEVVPEKTQAIFSKLIAQRRTGMPLAYILGHAPFYGREFLVNSTVLIPRNETEELTKHLLSWLQENDRNNGRVLDLGTGSGCLAITLKKERPTLTITASDISPAALTVAQTNAATNDADITFRQSDLLSDLPNERFDLIVANLPYIPSGELNNISHEVVGFEPVLALDGGPDGLDLIRKFLLQLPAYIKPGGLVALEIWHTQGATIKSLTPKDWAAQILPDLAGQDRFVLITCPAHQA